MRAPCGASPSNPAGVRVSLEELSAKPASPHPIIFLILYLPFGMSGGYATVTLVYQLHQAGIGVAAVNVRDSYPNPFTGGALKPVEFFSSTSS